MPSLFTLCNGLWLQGRRKGGVLVHCYAGQSRSVALMLAYLCSALHMRLADAFQLVLHARPSACPNSGRTLCNFACLTSDFLS